MGRGWRFLTAASLAVLLTAAVPATASAASPPGAREASAYQEFPAVVTTVAVFPGPAPLIGQSITFTVRVNLLDPNDSRPIPDGTITLSTAGVSLGQARAGLDAADPSALSLTITVGGLGVAGKPGAPLTVGFHQVDATFTPTGSSTGGTTGSTSVRVSFNDYAPAAANSSFYEDVMWLSGQHITTGNADGGFHPNEAVSRQAMAAFLYRSANLGDQPPACVTQQFWDVPVKSPFCAEIGWLAASGITTGYPDPGHALPGFHPTAPVSRQAMAAFLYRSANPGQSPAPCTKAPFRDVAAGWVFCPQIAWLATSGVTAGYVDGTFRPAAPVSRQAMAAFLHRQTGGAIGKTKQGTVVVKPTTAAPVAVTDQQVTLPHGTSAPVGAVLVVQPGPGAPSGYLGTVTAVADQGGTTTVTTTSTTIDQAYTSYSAAGFATMKDSSVTVDTQAGATSTAKGVFTLPLSAFTCTGAGDQALSVTLDISDLRIDASLQFDQNGRQLTLLTSSAPKVTATAAINGACVLNHAVSVHIPLGGGLHLDLEPALTLTADGQVTATLTESATSVIGLDIDGNSADALNSVVPQAKVTSFTGADLDVDASNTMGLTLFGTSGPTVQSGPMITGRWSDTAKCLTLSGAVQSDPAIDLSGWVPSWTAQVGPGPHGQTGPFQQWCDPAGDPAPVITNKVLTMGSVGKSYTATLSTADHRSGSWTIDGALPDGLALSDGAIAGTPTAPGTSTFRIRFDDGTQQSAITARLTIRPASPTGAVWAWGRNTSKQLGDGTTTSRPYPLQVDGLTDVTALAGNWGTGYALTSDGHVYAWGNNWEGEVGNGVVGDRVARPNRVANLSTVTTIAAGSFSAYALKADGTVWAWGEGRYGALGTGDYPLNSASTPVRVAGLDSVTAIVAAPVSSRATALRSDGTVWSWGWGGNDGLITYSPVKVAGLTDVISIGSAGLGGYALRSDGSLWNWKVDAHGTITKPVQVSGLSNVSRLVNGAKSLYVLRTDGTILALGSNRYGELGNGTLADSLQPVQIRNLTDIVAVAAVGVTVYALRADGTMWAWGNNTEGQLGNDTSGGFSALPVNVVGLRGMITVGASYMSGYAAG